LRPPSFAIRIWDLKTGKPVNQPAERVEVLAVSADGKLAALRGEQMSRLVLWDLAAKKEVRGFELPRGDVFRSVCFSPGGKHLAALVGYARVQVWDLDRGDDDFLSLALKEAYAINWSRDGKWLIGQGLNTAENDQAWEMPEGKEVRSPAQMQALRGALAFSSDGGMTVTQSKDGVALRDLKTGQIAKSFKLGSPAFRADLSRDGKRLAVLCTESPGLRVIDVESESIALEGRNRYNHYFTEVGFGADDRTVITTGLDGRIVQWRSATDRTEWQMPGPILRGWVCGDGRYLVTNNANGTGYVFRLDGGPTAR
jgi:WD40 repeat protein